MTHTVPNRGSCTEEERHGETLQSSLGIRAENKITLEVPSLGILLKLGILTSTCSVPSMNALPRGDLSKAL